MAARITSGISESTLLVHYVFCLSNHLCFMTEPEASTCFYSTIIFVKSTLTVARTIFSGLFLATTREEHRLNHLL
jgi:hypothetical protein